MLTKRGVKGEGGAVRIVEDQESRARSCRDCTNRSALWYLLQGLDSQPLSFDSATAPVPLPR